jgi:hypothetical protein
MRLRALRIVGGLSDLNVNLCVFDPIFLKCKVLFYFSILVIKNPRCGSGIIKKPMNKAVFRIRNVTDPRIRTPGLRIRNRILFFSDFQKCFCLWLREGTF